jgi:hypothetical protein
MVVYGLTYFPSGKITKRLSFIVEIKTISWNLEMKLGNEAENGGWKLRPETGARNWSWGLQLGIEARN